MKTLITIPCLLQGGTEIQTLNLARALHNSGWQVVLICYFEFERSVVTEFESAGVRVVLLNWKREISPVRFINKLRLVIRQSKPEIVHIQYMSPGALPIIAARLAGIKKIFSTVHQPYTNAHGRFAKFILRLSSILCTKFIAVSVNAEKSWFGRGQLYNENKSVKSQPHHFTIYNSVDTEKILNVTSSVDTSSLKKNMAIPSSILVIGAVSRLRYEKGIDLLIEAFNQLIKRGMKVHLLLVGTGPDDMNLKEKVNEYSINHNVTFYGESDWENAMHLMILMDIVVVPSRFEGFGLTAAEAMALSKPVISSDSYGLKEVVINEVTGLIFPMNDIKSLNLAMETLCSNLTLRKQLGVKGKERVSTFFSKELYLRKINSLYNEFIIL